MCRESSKRSARNVGGSLRSRWSQSASRQDFPARDTHSTWSRFPESRRSCFNFVRARRPCAPTFTSRPQAYIRVQIASPLTFVLKKKKGICGPDVGPLESVRSFDGLLRVVKKPERIRSRIFLSRCSPTRKERFFAKASKNSTGYRSENDFVRSK